MNVTIQLTDVDFGTLLNQLRVSTKEYRQWTTSYMADDIPESTLRILQARKALGLSERMCDSVYDYDPDLDPSTKIFEIGTL